MAGERRRRRSAYDDLGPGSGRGREQPVAGADLSPGHPRGRGPRRPRWRIEGLGWRALALVCAAGEIALVGWLLLGPALRVHHVAVSGLAHLSEQEVVAASAFDGRYSILMVDGESTRRRLEKMTWVRTAAVSPQLPDRVTISVEEWKPVALYRNGPSGKPFYVSDQGITLGPAESASGLPLVEGSAISDPRAGSRALDAQLLGAMIRMVGAVPNVYGQAVAKFNLDCVGALSVTTTRGVRLLFGRVLTPEEFASLSTKLSSLKSVAATDPDVRNPEKIEYINLENAQQPAVKFRSDHLPPAPIPTPAATPAPAPRTATAGPSPSPGAGTPPAHPSPAAPTIEVSTCR